MIPFHRFLIGTAIAFCVGMAWWSFGVYRLSGNNVQLTVTIAFAVGAVALSYYLWHLERFLHPGARRQ